jgi:hypothetical protein
VPSTVPSPEPTPPKGSQAERTLAALEGIRSELTEIKEILVSTTNDGMPLSRQVPSAELIASLIGSLAFLLRDTPLHEDRISKGAQAGQMLGLNLIQLHDAYMAATQAQRLDQLSGR